MPTTDPIAELVRIVRAEVGYHEGRSNGHWDNREKYAGEVPGLEWVSTDAQPWCAVFDSWAALKAGLAAYYPRTASTDTGAAWFIARGQFYERPAVGALIYYARGTDEYHTGVVVDFDDHLVTTVEGNTNDSGSAEGDGVYLKTHHRDDPDIEGYGYPEIPGVVLRSADAGYQASHKTPPTGPKPAPDKTLVERARILINRERKDTGPGPRHRKLQHALRDLPKR